MTTSAAGGPPTRSGAAASGSGAAGGSGGSGAAGVPIGPPRWVPASALALALAGLAVSVYLTVAHYTASVVLACPDRGAVNCEKVTTSPQSELLGIPVAVLGLAYFAAMVGLATPAAWRSARRWVRAVRVFGAAGGIAFVLYLVYTELFTLDAICLWCTAVHVLTFGLFAVTALGTASAAEPAR